MKCFAKISILSIFIFYSCRDNQTTNNIKTTEPKTTGDNNFKASNFSDFYKKKFSYLFEHKEEESYQLIGINVIGKKTIDFHLITETLPCDTEYWGVAENKYWDKDGEIDEDNSEGYLVDEYLKEEKEYIVGIRIAEDMSKLKIKFIQKDSLETDCFPITEKTMQRIK